MGDKPASHVYLFSANISDRFLNKLARPGETPAPDSNLVVRRVAVPIQLYERFGTFISRLDLGPEMCAAAAANSGMKRKQAGVDEVGNAAAAPAAGGGSKAERSRAAA